jgi:peptidyl-prolyl cis-trans isomerase D
MSVIQTIRDRAAWIIIAAIAVALIAFIVQDALQGRGGGWFGGRSTLLGKVNGVKIEAADFELRYKQVEENYRNQNYPINEQFQTQIRESLWNDYLEKAILEDEYDELGLSVTDKELGDILYGANPPQELRQQFTDSTGRYDGNAAYNAIRSIKKNTAQYRSFWGEFVPGLERNRQREKFTALISNSTYVPKWLIEKTNAENSQLSSISYVSVPYSSISDSTIKVTDDDVKQYVNEHKDQFKQEESRSFQYVSFNAGPSGADSTTILNQVATQKNAMATATDIQNFLITNNSETPFFDGYVLGSHMQMTAADTLKRLAEGTVYGPYLDGNNYVLAKLISKRNMPDSVKVRHILIKMGDEKGQIRSDSVAKKLIDSIVTAIHSGANFDSMVVKFSDDEGSKMKGGEYDFSSTQYSTISKEFADVIFYGNTGDKKTVKVENSKYQGYHYMEVLSQKKIEPAYKIAYLSRPILPSNESVNSAIGLASQFAAESRNYEQFQANSKKKNLNVFTASEIAPLASTVMGLGDSRELVRWAYNDAGKGEVADHPFAVGDKYVVPVLTQVYEKGTMPVDKAKPIVEYKIRNNKKAAQIIQKIGSANTLDAVAKATGQQIFHADSLNFSTGFIPNVGQDFKLVGASFNKEYQTKISPPIKGEIGVFVIKVENISAVPNPAIDVKQQQAQIQKQQGGMAGYRVMDALKKVSNIKDYRSKFF